MHNKELKQAFYHTTPTLFAYFPLGVVFGVLFAHADYPWYLAPVMSGLVYAGAVQMVALSMMIDHAGLVAIIVATLFIALRNSFYGLSVKQRFAPAKPLMRCFLIFGLVDATYALFVTRDKQENDITYCFYVTLLVYLYWVVGTFIGAYFANVIPEFKGLEFVLTSFFAILVIEYYLLNKKVDALIIPMIAAAIAYSLMPQYFLVIAILLCVFYLYIKVRCCDD